MSTLKIEHIANIANSGPDISIDTSGHLNIVNGSLQMGGTTMLDTSDTTLKNVSKIGISTASPADKLEIQGSGSDGIRLSVSGQSYYHKIRSNGDGLLLSADDSDAGGAGADIRFRVANDEKMRINHDGNVMLGTVVTGRAAEGAHRLTIANDTGPSGLTIRSGTGGSNYYGSINFSDSEGGTGEYAGSIFFAHGSLGDKLVLATGGTDRVTVDSTGVGIGTQNPDQKMHLYTSAGTTLYKAEVNANSTVGLEIKKTGSTTQSWQIADGITHNGALQFYDVTDSAVRMHIDGAGNIGINTTAPGAKLEILQPAASIYNDNSGNALRLEYAGNYNAGDIGAMMTFAQQWYASSSDVVRTGGIAGIKTIGSGAFGGGLAFYAQPNSGSDMNQAMVINHAGNVGINTSVPASNLDVKGDLRITRNVAAGHASEGNWNFTVSMAGASDYGSLYLTPSVSTGEFSIMGDKLRVTQSSGIQIISDSSNSTSSDNVAIRYNGTAGAHQSGYLFKDKRDAVNAAVKNNLRDDGAGTAAAFLEFYTSTGGTLAKAMSIGRYGEVAFDKMPNFATRPFYTDTSLGAGAVVDMYDAHVNTGNHFNGSTNRFTAPYAGNYYFAFHSNIYRPGGAGIMYFNWHKNGTDITTTYGGRIYGYWTGGWENMMGFIVLPLAANDYIDIRAGGGGPKVDGGAYGQFVGYALTTP